MADDGGRPPSPPQLPRLSRREKGKAKVGEPTDYASDDDQSHRDSPVPDSRNNASGDRETEVVRVPINPRPRPIFMTKEGICLKLKVSSIEVLEPHPKLNLSSDEASLLTGCDEILLDPPIRFSMDLVLFDASDRRYDMNISNHESGSLSRFHVNTEWQKFVLAKQIKERYELLFYRFLDDVAGQIYYRLEYFKVPESRPPTSDDQSSKKVPRRIKSSDPAYDDEDCWLSKTLTSFEVDPVNPLFYLDNEDAYDLTGCEDLLRPPSASCSKTLHVNDDFDRTYNLRLSPYFLNQAWAGYFICGDWRDLVRANNLEAGDEILFYIHLFDANTSDCYYYDLKVIRNKPEVKVDNKEESIDHNVHLSVLPDYDTMCLSKTLTEYEGVHDGGKPRLFLDASVASVLIRCPDIDDKYPVGKLRENLMVFDDDNIQYDMLLSNFETPFGDVFYAVDAGWQRFVKNHNLTTGDHIMFYRFVDETFPNKPFYMVRYIRKEES